MCFATKTFKTIAKINEPAVEAETTQEIYLHNFRTPLSIYPTLLSYGLTGIQGCIVGFETVEKRRTIEKQADGGNNVEQNCL